MSKELAVVRKPEMSPFKKNVFSFPLAQEMTQIMDVCKVLATCPYYQKLGLGGIVAIYLTAKELNLPPMMCLNGGMYTFSGQVSLSAQMINMMIINAGHRISILELTPKVCHLKFVRSGGEAFDYKYTIEDAAAAGYLNKDNWKKTPRDMLFSRCLSGGGRKWMPDALMGCYAVGELEDDGHVSSELPDNLPVEEGVVIEPNKPIEAKVEEKINEDQVQTLALMIGEIGKEYLDKFKSFIKNLDKCHASDLPDIPISQYDRLHKMLTKRLEDEDAKKAKTQPEENLFDVDAIEKEINERGTA